MPLTDTAIRNAKPKDKPYKMADGEGLLIWVQPSGAKGWRLKYRIGGKEKLLSLGVYPEVSLKDARKARDNARALIASGLDPAAARKVEAVAEAEEQDTFEKVAHAWWQHWKGSCTPTHADNTLKRLKADVLPIIGHVPVKKLTAPMLLAMAKRIALNLLRHSTLNELTERADDPLGEQREINRYDSSSQLKSPIPLSGRLFLPFPL